MRSPVKEGLFGAALLAALAGSQAGCAQVFGLDKQYVDTSASTGGGGSAGNGGATSGGAAGSGGASSGGSTTTSSSTTTPTPCKVDQDCPSAPLCQTAKCVVDTCENTPVQAGAPCLAGSSKTCDGKGSCVECTKDEDCKSAKCVLGVCSASCVDGLRNGGESDVDCGGPTCPKCADLHHCNTAADCAGGFCGKLSLCVAPTCSDGMTDGVETDLDCGGGLCPKCLSGRHCNVDGDCLGNICTGGSKHCLGSNNYCSDGLWDALETDVACGGKECKKCGLGQGCKADSDCKSNLCTGGACAPSCTDGVKDNVETDVDCGGGTCPGCGAGKMCLSNADCKGGLCAAGVCQPTCSDGAKNGAETDVDCGGGKCSPCATGKTCVGNADCASMVCNAGICG
jgi:hypothetical protein